jgi:hypothetical protein
MPEPRELQSQVSASVNQAVMRGMAVEATHRPASVDEWLFLLTNPQFDSHVGATIPFVPPTRRQFPGELPPTSVSTPLTSRSVMIGSGAALAIFLTIATSAVWHRQGQPSIPPSTPASAPPSVIPLAPVELGLPAQEATTQSSPEPTDEPTPSTQTAVERSVRRKNRLRSTPVKTHSSPTTEESTATPLKKPANEEPSAIPAHIEPGLSNDQPLSPRVQTPSSPTSEKSSPVPAETPQLPANGGQSSSHKSHSGSSDTMTSPSAVSKPVERHPSTANPDKGDR